MDGLLFPLFGSILHAEFGTNNSGQFSHTRYGLFDATAHHTARAQTGAELTGASQNQASLLSAITSRKDCATPERYKVILFAVSFVLLSRYALCIA